MRENITIAFVKIKIKDYTTLAPSSAKNFLSLKFAFIVNNSLFVIVIVKHCLISQEEGIPKKRRRKEGKIKKKRF